MKLTAKSQPLKKLCLKRLNLVNPRLGKNIANKQKIAHLTTVILDKPTFVKQDLMDSIMNFPPKKE